uniref:Proteasome subunit beta n=1 Tax=Electrophorus electricus TaxID=8005 RepID=A0A4W4F318_ELEEL
FQFVATMYSAHSFEDNGKMRDYHYTGPVEHKFSPYAFNGGTVLAVAGEDFAIVASDTRLSEGYSIHSRDSPKCYKLTDRTVIGCSGFHGDCLTLTKIIDARLKMYKHANNKTMTSGAIAAMLSTILYGRRRLLMAINFHQPLLDNQIGFKNMENVEQLPLTLEKAVQLVKDVFISAAERDVYTGDALKICIITKEGIREEMVPLRKD